MMMTYYNPAVTDGSSLIEQNGVPSLNKGIRRRASKTSVLVAPVDNAFDAHGGMSSAVCSLTWYCSSTYPGIAIPNSAGAALIAATFKSAGATF